MATATTERKVTSSDERKARARKIAEQALAARSKETESNKVAEEVIVEDFNMEDDSSSSGNRKAISEDSEEEFEKSTREEDAFLRRTIQIPSKRKVKKAFASETIVGDEYGEIMTEGKQRELEYQLLSDSAKAERPKLLLGRVRGVEPVTDSRGRIYTYEAKVSLITDPSDPVVRAQIKEGKEPSSIYSVYIPAPMFFIYRNPQNFQGENGLTNLHREMRSRIGSLIDFVVYHVDPTDERVIGSRIRAMQIKSARHYLSARHRDVVPGTKAYARVTYVGNKGIQAEVLGAECFIPNVELSWLHLNAASDMFAVGDSIPVVVKTVETDKTRISDAMDFSFVRITVSAKEAMKKPVERFGAKYCIGGTYDGEVTYRMTTALYFVRLGGEIDCVCKAPSFNTPHIGQKCSVIIKGKTDEGLTGSFTYLGK